MDWTKHPLWQKGLDDYHRDLFFEAHEHWESLWKIIPGPERELIQACIQIAAAFHLRKLGRTDAAERVMNRSKDHWDAAAKAAPELASSIETHLRISYF